MGHSNIVCLHVSGDEDLLEAEIDTDSGNYFKLSGLAFDRRHVTVI